jgi:hypothetical protein
VKEKLLTSRKRKFSPAVDADQLFVNKTHTLFWKSGNEEECLSGHTIAWKPGWGSM